MARKSKLTKADIESADLAEFERREGRNLGFDKMSERDRGWSRLSNGIIIEWPVAEAVREDWKPYTSIPEGHFFLHIDGKKLLFEADDFLKYLRWV